LNSRMKIGRPGSRRFRHWENEFFLLKNLSETESECDSEYSDDWDESYDPSYGLFSAVFEDDNKEIWEPFIDTTEEQQRILLALSDYDDDSSEDTFDLLSAAEAFALLRRRSQRTLQRHKNSHLLKQLDNIIFAFTNGLFCDDSFEFLRPDDTGEALIFAFQDKFQRHLLHSVCEFYDLVSYSMDSSEERITIVHAQREKVLRESSLLQFLNSVEDEAD